jgi:hypothetical protein
MGRALVACMSAVKLVACSGALAKAVSVIVTLNCDYHSARPIQLALWLAKWRTRDTLESV